MDKFWLKSYPDGVPAEINPDQYRDEIYKRIATGAKHAVSFYGPEYGVEVMGLDRDVAWQQVSNTEVFLYIPYTFKIEK